MVIKMTIKVTLKNSKETNEVDSAKKSKLFLRKKKSKKFGNDTTENNEVDSANSLDSLELRLRKVEKKLK